MLKYPYLAQKYIEIIIYKMMRCSRLAFLQLGEGGEICRGRDEKCFVHELTITETG